MALKSPSLSMSSTSFTTPSPSPRLQPHKLPTLSFDYPTSAQLFPKIKTPTTITLLPLCSPRFRASATSIDGFQASESEDFDDLEDEFEEEVEKTPVASEGSRLYVGNLPYTMTSSELTDIFKEAGRVVSVEIVYDRVTDRSRGFAFVTMQSAEEAKEAIRMYSGALVGGRTVKVNFPEVPRGGERDVLGPRIQSSYRGYIDSPYKIYAGNLSWIITSQHLKDAFKDRPGVLSAKVIYERETGRSRGFGFVTFGNMKDAESALEAMNGVEVGGRPLRLNLAAAGSASTLNSQPHETKSEPDTADGINETQANATVT